MNVPHRIRRQRWQIRTARAADAFAVRTALHNALEPSLLPALEQAFDALDDGQREIHLPRLELKLSLSSADALADELPALIREAAQIALAEALEAAPEVSPARPSGATPASRLRHYLNSGQVEWFDAGCEHAQLLQQLADEARQWGASPAAAWPALLAGLPDDGVCRSAAFFRFLQLLDEPMRAIWRDFAGRLAESSGEPLAGAQAQLRQWQLRLPSDGALRLQALGLLLLTAGPTRSPRRQNEWKAAVRACAGVLGATSTVDPKKWLKMETLFDDTGTRSGELNRDNAPDDLKNSPIFPVDRRKPDNGPEVESAPGLALRSAGLILLHPYLPRLFSTLGWIRADHPSGEPFPWAELPRAAALLNWLATGRDEPHEFEIGTAKLLLGLGPDDALPVAGGLLGDAEREEGEALLGAVVQHWSALGNTSIDGLRLSFLQRGGLLYPAADGWLLRPQIESFDMLLDRLPWGIAIVRLPWMRRTLHTEWVGA